MKKILKNKVIIFIIAFAIAILQPVNGFLTVKASALPNPKPDLVVVPKPDNAEIIDFATRTKVNAYDAKITNMGKMSTSNNYNTAVAALEYAYTAAGIVAENGAYKDEYKARIQYIKDNSVLPAPLNNLEAEIFFATLDYADMTIGYYMDSAGKKVGNGYVKYKEPSERAAKAFHDAIKDTNYWSKPFKFIDGNTYTDKICLGGSGTFIGYLHDGSQQIAVYTNIDAPGAYCFYDGSGIYICSDNPDFEYTIELVRYNLTQGAITSQSSNKYHIGGQTQDSHGHKLNYYFAGINVTYKDSYFCPFPEAKIGDVKDYLCPLREPQPDFDTSQTGISFMPAVVPATVPTSGKSFVDTDIETYVDGNKKLKPNKEGKVEIPTVFPQEVPFPEYDPEINPYVEPDTEIDPENPTPAPKPSANPQPTTNPDPVPDPDPAPNPDPLPSADPQPTTNPEPAPDPDPAPNPDPLPSANPQPSTNPEPEPEPDTETDLDVPSAIGKLDLLDRFPFCVPSDLIQGIKLFNATPTTPTWSWNLSVNGTPIQYTWVVSLDKFEKIAQLCRTLLTILFVWGLAKVTRYVIKG